MIGSLPTLVSKAISTVVICRSSTAARTTSRMSWSSICGLGVRAKAENSSTMRVTSPTWRMMVSVQRSKVSTVLGDHLAVLAAQALGRKLYRR